MKKTSLRCDEVIAQVIVREYDEHGRPVREQMSQPIKVFRASAPDFWNEVDKQLAAAEQPAQPPTPAPPAILRGKRK